MNKFIAKKASLLMSAGLIALVSACSNGGSGGDSGDGDVNTPAETLGTTNVVSNDFSFPAVSESADGMQVTIPEGPLPDFPARRALSSEGTGDTITFGDPVVLKYNMYSWTTGELVESTDNFDEALAISAGAAQGVPEYLSNSVLGRKVGDRLQVIFNAEMEDLPEYLDSNDAYVLVLDII